MRQHKGSWIGCLVPGYSCSRYFEHVRQAYCLCSASCCYAQFWVRRSAWQRLLLRPTQTGLSITKPSELCWLAILDSPRATRSTVCQSCHYYRPPPTEGGMREQYEAVQGHSRWEPELAVWYSALVAHISYFKQNSSALLPSSASWLPRTLQFLEIHLLR